MRTHIPVQLVGSVPLGSSREVFELCAGTLGGLLRRFPDGETGIRRYWIAWQGTEVLPKVSGVEVGGRGDIPNIPPYPLYRLKPGIRPAEVKFPTLGYAHAAKESYRVFKELQAAGRIEAGARFQVSLPSPFAVSWVYFVTEAKRAIWPVYEAAMFAELDAIAAAIPAEELAIQWDCGEVIALELPDLVRIYPKQELIAALIRAVDRIPRAAEAGIHLCYGDPGGKHLIEPTDLSLLVELANAIARGAHRPLTWVHMPVPVSRDDPAYFAPLTGLMLEKETKLFLGLIHLADGIEGASRRIGAARQHVPDFGIATECGLGRRPTETIPDILALHARVARAAL